LLTATQNTFGGVTFEATVTEADAVLFAVVVSGLFPTTVAVFVTVPGVLGVVTRVMVTVAPAAMFPMSQVRIAPPVHEPCVEEADTNVLPAGIGSVTVTPVSAPGPLLVTTIVHVMFPGSVTVLGEPDFVIARSTSPCAAACTHVDALEEPGPAFEVVT
jgi:hypothetical protein